jgi:RNA polymerase sigma-70 factor (ECF subfamily)
VARLRELLAEDAILVSDGGGKRTAALRVMVGREDVIGLIQGIVWRHGDMGVRRVQPVRINGCPGLLVDLQDGPETFALEPGEDGRIAAIYVMRNPEKLRHVP